MTKKWYHFGKIGILPITIAGKLVYVPTSMTLPIELKAREYEVFTVVPVKIMSSGAAFAPIGLIKMFNSGGAVKELKYESKKTGNVEMRTHGCGVFGAYSSVKPKRVVIDMNEVKLDYEEKSGLVTFTFPESMNHENLTFEL